MSILIFKVLDYTPLSKNRGSIEYGGSNPARNPVMEVGHV